MKNILIGFVIVVMISGCSGYRVERCVKDGYSGIVVDSGDYEPTIYCSNGNISPRGCFETIYGEKCSDNVFHYIYLDFNSLKGSQ